MWLWSERWVYVRKKIPGSGVSLNISDFPTVFEGRNVWGCAERKREGFGLGCADVCFNDLRDSDLQLAPLVWYWIAGKKKCLMDLGAELAQRCSRQHVLFGCEFLVLTNKRDLKLIKSLCFDLRGNDCYKTKHWTSLCGEGLAVCGYGLKI